jgi:D-sedoheptulose 7-phosphate isomerase
MTDFLYPFIEAGERDAGQLLTDLAASAAAKAVESGRLRAETVERLRPALEDVATAMAARVGAGGRTFTFGNGGSATDAQSFARLLVAPPSGRAVAARCLSTDVATITALANDVGFELVFSRQLIAHGRAGDIAVGFSTSGTSRNLLAAFREAKRRGILTIGLAGYDGGDMARGADVDHCLVVDSPSVHRIQEAQAAVCAELWRVLQRRLEASR